MGNSEATILKLRIYLLGVAAGAQPTGVMQHESRLWLQFVALKPITGPIRHALLLNKQHVDRRGKNAEGKGSGNNKEKPAVGCTAKRSLSAFIFGKSEAVWEGEKEEKTRRGGIFSEMEERMGSNE